MPPPPPFQVNSWRRAEENAAAWMRWWGFPDAELTEAGTDGGVDVRAAGALAQVKAEATQTGRPVLQQLAGARRPGSTQALFFFSGAGFGKLALAYADDWEIACFTYDLFGAMTPANGAARKVLRQVEEREAAAERAREAATASEARRLAEEREAAVRRQREAPLAEERRQAARSTTAKADKRTTAERRAADAQAFADARRRADERVEAALQASWRGTTSAQESTGRTAGGPRGAARGARRITEPLRVQATRADSPGATRRPATVSPKTKSAASGSRPRRPGTRRRTMPRLVGALVCVALAAFALVNALTSADADGAAGVAIFSVLAVLLFSSYRAAVGHNRERADTPL
jgi:hypothetical protein